jgi:hypothetical protein
MCGGNGLHTTTTFLFATTFTSTFFFNSISKEMS